MYVVCVRSCFQRRTACSCNISLPIISFLEITSSNFVLHREFNALKAILKLATILLTFPSCWTLVTFCSFSFRLQKRNLWFDVHNRGNTSVSVVGSRRRSADGPSFELNTIRSLFIAHVRWEAERTMNASFHKPLRNDRGTNYFNMNIKQVIWFVIPSTIFTMHTINLCGICEKPNGAKRHHHTTQPSWNMLVMCD